MGARDEGDGRRERAGGAWHGLGDVGQGCVRRSWISALRAKYPTTAAKYVPMYPLAFRPQRIASFPPAHAPANDVM